MGDTRPMMDFADHLVNAAKIAESLHHNRSHKIIDNIPDDEANAERKRDTYIDIIARGVTVAVLEELAANLPAEVNKNIGFTYLVNTIKSRELK